MNKIIYLDAAASAQKPAAVMDVQLDFLRNKYANAGRGICARAAETDAMVDAARRRVAEFINAAPENIVFTSGTTDGMNRIVNIIKNTFADFPRRVAVSDLDHHSARMPWEWAMHEIGGDVLVCPLDADFNIDVDRIPAADVFVITAMSNVLGMPLDVAKIVRAAREKNPNVITIVDAAQYVAHGKIDVRAWDCDFMCFSGHKIGADTGVGIMYIKNPDAFLPDKFGGGMVNRVRGISDFSFSAAPSKFEAGTLPLTQIAGLPAAIDAWEKWDGAADLVRYIYDGLAGINRVKILTARDAALVSFVVSDMHPLDVGAGLGARNICVRAGNMCASWIHAVMGLSGSVRISVGPWNTMDDAQSVVRAITEMVN